MQRKRKEESGDDEANKELVRVKKHENASRRGYCVYGPDAPGHRLSTKLVNGRLVRQNRAFHISEDKPTFKRADVYV